MRSATVVSYKSLLNMVFSVITIEMVTGKTYSIVFFHTVMKRNVLKSRPSVFETRSFTVAGCRYLQYVAHAFLQKSRSQTDFPGCDRV